jgi:hypothetical protein
MKLPPKNTTGARRRLRMRLPPHHDVRGRRKNGSERLACRYPPDGRRGHAPSEKLSISGEKLSDKDGRVRHDFLGRPPTRHRDDAG